VRSAFERDQIPALSPACSSSERKVDHERDWRSSVAPINLSTAPAPGARRTTGRRGGGRVRPAARSLGRRTTTSEGGRDGPSPRTNERHLERSALDRDSGCLRSRVASRHVHAGAVSDARLRPIGSRPSLTRLAP
jgi:hypothetical protein